MLQDLISIAVAAGGAGLVWLAVQRARAKWWAGSLQLGSIGFLLIGASAIGIVGFLAGIAFSPLAWLGVAALGIAGVLFVAGQRLEGRAPKPAPKAVQSGGGGRALPAARREKAPAVDDDLADIEAILKKHGIS
ncbi:MAG: hypothetical protein ACRDWI_08345 [Jiangellaceae bacterium]